MGWKIEFDQHAAKEFSKLDKDAKKMITKYLKDKVLTVPHPRDLGKFLKYDYTGLWRYRVDKFRIICHLEEDSNTILVLRIGLRDQIY